MDVSNVKKTAFSLFLIFFYLGSFFYFVDGLQKLRNPFTVISFFFAIVVMFLKNKHIYSEVESKIFISLNNLLYFLCVAICVCLYIYFVSTEFGLDISSFISLLMFWFVVYFVFSLNMSELEGNATMLRLFLYAYTMLNILAFFGFIDFINTNSGGLTSVSLLILSFYLFLFKKINFIKYLLITLLSIVLCVYYQSRTSAIIAIICFVLSIISSVSKKQLLLISIILFVLVILFMETSIFQSLINKNEIQAGKGDLTNGRIYVWLIALDLINAFGNHSSYISKALPYGVHNSYLGFTIKFGWLQLLIILFFLFAFCLKHARHVYFNPLLVTLLLPFFLFAMYEEVLGSHVFLVMLLGLSLIKNTSTQTAYA